MRFRVVIGAVAVMAAASLAAAIALLATRPDERVDTPPASKTPATATTTAAIALEPAPPEPTPPEVRAEGAAAGEPVPPPPDEEDLDAMEREARVAFVRGEGERSARLFRRIVERAPERASAWRGLGLVALAYGDHREARRALERYLELAPDARDRRRMERELRALR